MREPAFVYVLANKAHTALYIGFMPCEKLYTWYQRVKFQPKTFDAPYIFDRLVHVEMFARGSEAVKREKTLKSLSRIMQRRLVNEYNAGWDDLLDDFVKEMERLRLV